MIIIFSKYFNDELIMLTNLVSIDFKCVDIRYNSDDQKSINTNMSTDKNVYFGYFCILGNAC